jgi:DNA polymerase I-like protein with 3'-5' exonuclease and polymerase domains
MVQMRDRHVKSVVLEGFDLLQKEIRLVRPNVIVAFGNVSMWALTGNWGIKAWRGSMLEAMGLSASTSSPICVIPAYHPAYIMRDWTSRAITVNDLKRAAREKEKSDHAGPNYSFVIRPNYDQVLNYLQDLHQRLEGGVQTLAVDIETRAGHIACLGIASGPNEAFCIPFMCVEREEGYWPEVQEAEIIRQLRHTLCHPNAQLVGQNFIYDTQYIYRHWKFVPNFARDTMLAHHSCFSALPKGLDFLSSMYCAHHVYWKDEGKNWDSKTPEDKLWSYNCKDAVKTYECDQEIQKTINRLGLRNQSDFQQRMFWPILKAMVRGVRVDTARRTTLTHELRAAIDQRQQWIERILGHPFNARSPKQMKELFYGDFQQKEILNRKSGTITLNEEALAKIAHREPILRPLVEAITEQRSLGVFLSTFVEARLDKDGRIRCSYNAAGTSTFRLNSSQNAFGSGLNLQNIPAGDEEKDLPNIRQLFIPDEGMTFFKGDLDRADLQVVVWEADDKELKHMLRSGVDIHTENARLLFATREPTGSQRHFTKTWVHGTNYGGTPRTMAINCGITVHQAESFRNRWFSAHPGIPAWQERVAEQLSRKRYVENAFGNRWYCFDRVESVLGEALAWGPQSTVALYINRIWLRAFEELPELEVLLQVHDELAGQFPTHQPDLVKKLACIAGQTVVPYDDPLVIPLSLSTSEKSWGDCR